MTVKPMKFEEVVLERLIYAAETRLSREFAIKAKVNVEEYAGFAADELIYSVRQGILGQKLDSILVEYPDDWWQAVKERFAPAWALRRWPVRMKKYELTATAVYPKIAIPEQQHSIILRINGPLE